MSERELRIQLGARREVHAADHLWRSADAPRGSELPLHGVPPDADRYLVLLPPERAVLFEVDRPRAGERQLADALPFLVEERLAEPLERYVIVALPAEPDAQPGARLRVVALEKDWLAEVRQQLAAIHEGELRWVLAGSQWRLPAGVWALRFDGEHALAALGQAIPAALAASAAIGALRARLSEAQAGAAGPLRSGPAAIWLHGASAAQRSALESVAADAGIALQEVGDAVLPSALDGDYAAAPVVFRQLRSPLRRALGEWRSLAPWRAALLVLAVFAVVEVAGLLARWAQLAGEARSLRAGSVELFRAIAGPQAAVVDPALQMRRLHHAALHATGQPTPDDFLPLLNALSAVFPLPGVAADEIRYAAGRLEIVLPAGALAAAPGGAAALEDGLRRAGWQATLEASPGGPVRLKVGRL